MFENIVLSNKEHTGLYIELYAMVLQIIFFPPDSINLPTLVIFEILLLYL